MELYWTSRKTINGLKHFVLINQYEFKKETYLDIVSVLDESISFTISKKVFEESSQWIKSCYFIEKENIDIKEYLEFVSALDGVIGFTISKKVFEESSQWIKGWDDNERENIDIKEYLEFKSSIRKYKTNKIIFNETSKFNIS